MVEGGVGVGASYREGKSHVIESLLSSSFVWFSDILTTTCKENRFPRVKRFKCPSNNMVSLGITICSPHLMGSGSLPFRSKREESVTFLLVDTLRKDTKPPA